MLRSTGSLTRVFLLLLVLSLCVAALLAISVLISGDLNGTDGKILASTLTLSLASMTGLAGAAIWQRVRALALFAIGTSLAALLLAQLLIWGDYGGDAVGKSLGLLTTAAVASAYVSLLELRRRPEDRHASLGAHWLAVGSAAVTAALICFFILSDDIGDVGGRLLGVLGVLVLLGSSLAVIFRRLEGDRQPRTDEPLVGQRVEAVEGKTLVLESGRRLRLAKRP